MTGSRVALGPLVVQVDVRGGAAAEAKLRAWSRFEVQAPPDVFLRLRLSGPGPDIVPDAHGQVPLPALTPAPDGSALLVGAGCRAWLSPDRTRAEVEGADVPTALDVMLRAWLAECVTHRGGLLVHGVALVHAGRAALFTGQSGAGKSTLGALWQQAGGALLADELVPVLPTAEGPVAWGTPWNVGATGSAPLRLLGTLAWAGTHALHPAPAVEVARTLLGNVVLAERGPAAKAEALRRASVLLATVQPVQLAFARDTGVAGVLRTALERA